MTTANTADGALVPPVEKVETAAEQTYIVRLQRRRRGK